MRTHGVVVRPPCLDDPSRRSERGEQVLVQALVAQATIERFHEAVLLRLARRSVMPLDAGVLAPGEDGVTVSSVPLSLTTMHGSPRRLAMAVSSRTTRRPDNEVSTMQARHSRL